MVGLDDLLIEHFSFEDGIVLYWPYFAFTNLYTLGTQYNLFLDAGYRVGHSMITPFRIRRDMTADEQEWNRYIFTDFNSYFLGRRVGGCKGGNGARLID